MKTLNINEIERVVENIADVFSAEKLIEMRTKDHSINIQKLKEMNKDDVNALTSSYNRRFFYPVFDFRYISLNNTTFCFNNLSNEPKDFANLMNFFCEISKMNYEEISKLGHYHHVPINKIGEDILNDLSKKMDMKIHDFVYLINNKYVDFIQIPIYFDNGEISASRVFGFVSLLGIFHPVLFDVGHEIYKDTTKS